jgi:hypothetical protein
MISMDEENKTKKCQYRCCQNDAKWVVDAVFGMTPRREKLYLCDLHKDKPRTILNSKRISDNE